MKIMTWETSFLRLQKRMENSVVCSVYLKKRDLASSKGDARSVKCKRKAASALICPRPGADGLRSPKASVQPPEQGPIPVVLGQVREAGQFLQETCFESLNIYSRNRPSRKSKLFILKQNRWNSFPLIPTSPMALFTLKQNLWVLDRRVKLRLACRGTWSIPVSSGKGCDL